MRWMDGLTNSMDMSWESFKSWWWKKKKKLVMDREAWHAAVHDWATERNWTEYIFCWGGGALKSGRNGKASNRGRLLECCEIINHILLLSELHSFINIWVKQLFFSCAFGSIYLLHRFCLFLPLFWIKFSFSVIQFEASPWAPFALEIPFHFFFKFAFSWKSFFLSLSPFFLNLYFAFFSFHPPGQLWFIFILCAFIYELPPVVLFLFFLS